MTTTKASEPEVGDFWADTKKEDVDAGSIGWELMGDLRQKMPDSVMCEALLSILGYVLVTNARDDNHLIQLQEETDERLDKWMNVYYEASELAVQDAKKTVG